MTLIKPFKGVRYDQSRAGDIANLVAPPYDIISEEEKQSLHKRSPHNIVHLDYGLDRAGDDEKDNKYARAAALWNKWRTGGILAMDQAPAIYRYQTEFQLKTHDGLMTFTRPGFVSLLKLQEYEDGIVRPHERTMAGPKEDRFNLILGTRAQFSQIMMFYSDPEAVIDEALGMGPPPGAEVLSVEDDIGVTHSLWPITDADAHKAVIEHLAGRPVYIADGHHRYETTLAVRRHLKKNSPLFAEGADYIMTYFTPKENEALAVLPYNRVIHNLPKRRLSGMLKKLESNFEIDRVLRSPIEPGEPRRDFMRELRKRGEERTVFGLVDGPNGHGYYLSIRPDADPAAEEAGAAAKALRHLDVVILEDLVLLGALGIEKKDLFNEKHVAYETDYDDVIDALAEENNQLGILLNPTPLDDVVRVSDLGGTMPEKSTYFFPKLATGLVLHDMEKGTV